MFQHRRLLLVAMVLAALPAALQAYGYGYGYGMRSYGWGYNPAIIHSSYYSMHWPMYGGREPLTDEDLYLGSKRKGDRYMKRNQFSRATREYREAHRRAVKYFGKTSGKAKQAAKLLAKAQDAFQRYGDARTGGAFQRARDKGDRYFDRGDYERARAQYQDALKRAHTDEQAQEVVAMLVRAQEAKAGRGGKARTRDVNDYKGRGDDAMQQGDYKAALGFYASALTRTSKIHGPESRQTRALTKLLTKAQQGLSGARSVRMQSDFRVAD